MEVAFVVGNPPYQNSVLGDDGRYRHVPLYHRFIDLGGMLAVMRSTIITPARFLSDAGATPHEWNREKLSSNHFVVERYYAGNTVFNDVDIKGGVCITSVTPSNTCKPIGTFIPNAGLRAIYEKTENWIISNNGKRLSSIISTTTPYRFSDEMIEMFGLMRQNKPIATNVFVSVPDAFIGDICLDNRTGCVYLAEDFGVDVASQFLVIGREKGSRTAKTIKKEWVEKNDYLESYNVLVPSANGDGIIGEKLSSPFIAGPGVICTGTFICIGAFNNPEPAKMCLKYIETRIARSLLATLKTTQHNARGTWSNIPMLDFALLASNKQLADNQVDELDAYLAGVFGLDNNDKSWLSANIQKM